MFNAYEYVSDEMRKAMVRNMLAAQFMQQGHTHDEGQPAA